MKVNDMLAGHDPFEADKMAAWLAQRAGKLTASRMSDAMAILRDGRPAKARSDLIRDLLAERLTGLSVRHYVSDAMQWGLDHETEAKEVYQFTTGNVINPCGFYDHPMIDNFGATPDGHISDEGNAEVKCPTTNKYVEWLLAGVVPEEHKPQMLAQMACTGRKWCEFIAFDPRIKEEKRRLFVRRFTPTRDEIANIETFAKVFLEDVERAWEQLTTQLIAAPE